MRGHSDELHRFPFHFISVNRSPSMGKALCKGSGWGWRGPKSIRNFPENLKASCVCVACNEINLPYVIRVPETRLFSRNEGE